MAQQVIAVALGVMLGQAGMAFVRAFIKTIMENL